MKALFKLKTVPYEKMNDMTNEYAEKAYSRSESVPSRVYVGFYSKKLTFIEWLQRYNINIL